MLAALFVGEGVDGIFVGSLERRINGSRERARKGDECSAEHPLGGELEAERGIFVAHEGAQGEREENAEDDSGNRQDKGFAQYDSYDVALGGAKGFEDADLAGALHDSGIHGLEDDQEADDDRDADDGIERGGEGGRCSGVMRESHSSMVCTW